MGGEFQGCLDCRQAHAAAGRERNSAFERDRSDALEDILAMPRVDGDIAARALEGSSWRAPRCRVRPDVVPGGAPVAGVLRQRAAQLLRAGAARRPGRLGAGPRPRKAAERDGEPTRRR
jgi:hypothetical protein